MKSGDPQGLRQLEDVRQLFHVVAGDAGVDLGGDTQFPEVLESCDGGVKCPGLAAESVVREPVGPVQADGNTDDPGVLDPVGHGLIDERAVGGQGYPHVLADGALGNIEDIPPPKRLPATQNQDQWGIFRNLIDDFAAFRCS